MGKCLLSGKQCTILSLHGMHHKLIASCYWFSIYHTVSWRYFTEKKICFLFAFVVTHGWFWLQSRSQPGKDSCCIFKNPKWCVKRWKDVRKCREARTVWEKFFHPINTFMFLKFQSEFISVISVYMLHILPCSLDEISTFPPC